MEADLEHVWLDKGWWLMPDGTRRLLSWNAATHELKLWSLHPQQKDIVLASIETEEEVCRRLHGWKAYNDTGEGLGWLTQRLEGGR